MQPEPNYNLANQPLSDQSDTTVPPTVAGDPPEAEPKSSPQLPVAPTTAATSLAPTAASSPVPADTPASTPAVTPSSLTADTPAVNPAELSYPPTRPLPAQPTEQSLSGVVVSGGTGGEAPLPPALDPKSKRYLPFLKPLAVLGGGILLFGGASATAYFGYFMNPSVIWQQSLANTGTGYTRLVNYLDEQSNKHYTGFTSSGRFQAVVAGSNFDGNFTSQSDGSNSTTSLTANFGVKKVGLDIRTVKAGSTGATDDYIRPTGIKGLGALLGAAPSSNKVIDSLDGQWISIDHNLVADFKQQLTQQNTPSPATSQLSWADVNAYLRTTVSINQRYLFTANKATSVTRVVKRFGTEKVDNRMTYHYTVGFVDANVKAYVIALCSTLQQSNLGKYLVQQVGQQAINTECTALEKDALGIKSTDTIDVWADISHRAIYKVRIPDATNPTQNFVDAGLDYKGGSIYPIFIKGQSKTGAASDTFVLTISLDSKANSLKTDFNIALNGSSPVQFGGTISLQPGNVTVPAAVPPNAKPITDILNSLGLGLTPSPVQTPGLGSTRSGASGVLSAVPALGTTAKAAALVGAL